MTSDQPSRAREFFRPEPQRLSLLSLFVFAIGLVCLLTIVAFFTVVSSLSPGWPLGLFALFGAAANVPLGLIAWGWVRLRSRHLRGGGFALLGVIFSLATFVPFVFENLRH